MTNNRKDNMKKQTETISVDITLDHTDFIIVMNTLVMKTKNIEIGLSKKLV